MESTSKIITLVSDLLSRCGGPLRGTFGGGSSFSVVRYTLMEQKSKLVDMYTTGGAAASVEAIHWNIPCYRSPRNCLYNLFGLRPQELCKHFLGLL